MQRKTTIRYEIGGSDRAVLCDTCIDTYQSKVKKGFLKLLAVCVSIALLAWLHIFYIQGGMFPGGKAKFMDTIIRFIALGSTLGGLCALGVLFNRPSNEEKGARAVISLKVSPIRQLQDKGFDVFWSPEEHQKLVRQNK